MTNVNNNADSISILDSVDARTRLAGSNTMELLLFSLGTKEIFGINVFKVREITRTPAITRAPNLPRGVEGVVSLRGSIIPVIALGKLIGIEGDVCSNTTMMVTEFSRHVQAFLIHRVNRIARVEWERVRAPDSMLVGRGSCITAVTELPEGKLASVLDVEHVLEHVQRADGSIFFADDSAVARKEIVRVLDMLAVQHQHAANGREAWERLQS